ncbi:MAG: divergent polysaccharide deacetylase family protein [Pseudomonadota bacterium]
MLRGVVLGSLTGMSLAGLLLVSVSLIVPPPVAQLSARVPDRPGAVAPPAPGESAVVRPDPLPQRPVRPAPVSTAGAPASDAVASDGVELPAGSQFSRPREDTAVVTPDRDARPRLSNAPAPDVVITPPGAPVADTQSAAIPDTAGVTGLAPPPVDGTSPDLPAPVDEAAPLTFREVGVAEEPAASGEGNEVVAEVPAAPANQGADANVAVIEDPAEPLPGPGPSVAEAVSEPVLPQESQQPVVSDQADGSVDIVVAEAPVVPEADQPDIVVEAAPIPTPEEPVEQPATLPDDGTTDGDVTVAAVSDAPTQTPAPRIRILASDEIVVPDRTSDDEPEVAAAEGAAEPEPAGPVVLPRRIVLDSEREAAEEEEPATETVEDVTPDATDPSSRALEAFAVPVERRPGTPVFSIVLIDDPAAGLPRDAVTTFDFPVAIAIDPTATDAAEAMAIYRGAGHEVLLLADALAPDGAAQDIEVALAGAQATVPEAVGVLDRPRLGFAARPTALRALLPSLEDNGMGLVTYPGGLGSGVATALREGVPAAQLYRVLDDGDERATVITRFLDRATFEAVQDGSAIVVGRTTPEMVEAISSWMLGNRFASIDVVPVSEVLRASVE